MVSTMLVIGNGFDLDLGLLTKYSDFADDRNPEWRTFVEMKGRKDISVYWMDYVKHMQEARQKENWFDIEQEIYKFVNGHNNPTKAQVGSIRLQHEQLIDCLAYYLARVAVTSNVKEKSLAKDLLTRLNSREFGCRVITYNYTDCISLCGLSKGKSKVFPIHGTLTFDTALGCREYGKKPIIQWDFLYKPSDYGKREFVKNTLTTAQEVIIFGHSLNRIDYCYFKDMFEYIRKGESCCSHLSIVCKDRNSESQIRENLKGNVDLHDIERRIHVQFIYSDLWYNDDVVTMKHYEELCRRNECA